MSKKTDWIISLFFMYIIIGLLYFKDANFKFKLASRARP